MSDSHGRAPWLAAQASQLLARSGHAWLLQGPSGLGQYQLALEVVSGWLCEDPGEQGACGNCPSCHAINVRTHADLCVLMPENVMLELGWPLDEKSQADIDDKKRKPSREIRVETMRYAIEFAQRTSSRGRGKAVLVYPAERMNPVTANALLKTLEEPPGDVRFVLASEAAHSLLPTIRSRCQTHFMQWPTEQAALDWLAKHGMDSADAHTLLRAAGGRPDDALFFASSGRDPNSWRTLPQAMLRGDLAPVQNWTAAHLIDAQHKLCHDLMVVQSGGEPRFFEASDMPSVTSLTALSRWQRDLARSARTAEHPFNAGLMLEALVNRAQTALNSKS